MREEMEHLHSLSQKSVNHWVTKGLGIVAFPGRTSKIVPGRTIWQIFYKKIQYC